MKAEMTVFVVDDDPGALRSMKWLLESACFSVKCYASGAGFMSEYDAHQPGCLLLDLQMPAMNGLVVQQWLVRQNARLPVIFLTGHGDVRICALAMKAGATDFLEKPVDDRRVLQAVRSALEEMERSLRVEAAHPEITARMHRLTQRETEILHFLFAGTNMKVIAGALDISIQTVAKHRTKVLEKMMVRNEVELVHLLAHFPLDGGHVARRATNGMTLPRATFWLINGRPLSRHTSSVPIGVRCSRWEGSLDDCRPANANLAVSLGRRGQGKLATAHPSYRDQQANKAGDRGHPAAEWAIVSRGS